MIDPRTLTEQRAFALIERLRYTHGIASTSTPAGILFEHPAAGSLSLALWDSREDLARLVDWLTGAGLAVEV